MRVARGIPGCLVIWGIISMVWTSAVQADFRDSGSIVLNGSVIVVDGTRSARVSHMVRDLQDYLREITQQDIQTSRSIGSKGTSIVVGPKAAETVLGAPLPVEEMGEQGYCIKTLQNGDRGLVVVTGSTAQGTRNGLAAFMRMIRTAGKSAYVKAPVDVVSRPSYAVRAIHFNGWTFNPPYSFRTWTEDEWKNYIDILGYQQVNLIYIWPFMELLPLPLSEEDKSCMREVRRIIDYAQKRHGMEVWLMQSANRVAANDMGVADPKRRPYWRGQAQIDRNPADPEDFRAIMESHEVLYRNLDNADGYCTIDSDPGGYPGSSLDDYIKVLRGNRSLIDRCTIGGRKTKLINWMWFGWGQAELGRFFDMEFQIKTLQALKSNLTEPLWLIAGNAGYLPLCKEAGLLEKTVFLPYGTIENEPSYPGTNTGFDGVNATFRTASDYPNLTGFMGNTMCPVIQFPRIYHQLRCSWDAGCTRSSEKEAMLELSELLYPENKDFIAECYASLSETDIVKLGRVTGKLQRLIDEKKLGRPGLFGRKLFPDSSIEARSLLMQLRLQLSLERMYSQIKSDSTRTQCRRLVADCLDSYLTWDAAHDCHGLWGDGGWTLGRFGKTPEFLAAMRRLRQVLGTNDSVVSFFKEIADGLKQKFERDPALEKRDYVMLNGIRPMQDEVLAIDTAERER